MTGQQTDTPADDPYTRFVLEKIRAAEESIRREGSIPHEEAKRRMSKWLGQAARPADDGIAPPDGVD